MHVLKVTGSYYLGDPTPEATMADMLRYDDGEMVSWKPIEGWPGKAHSNFEAEVHTNSFTPERRASFGLRAKLVETRKGKAGCNFADQESVVKFIHEQSGRGTLRRGK